MISNERPSPYGHRPRSSAPSKPAVPEDTLHTERLQIERKTFILALRENPRGRFLRITEDVGGRKDSIIIPAPGLGDFQRAIEAMARISDETPPTPG